LLLELPVGPVAQRGQCAGGVAHRGLAVGGIVAVGRRPQQRIDAHVELTVGIIERLAGVPLAIGDRGWPVGLVVLVVRRAPQQAADLLKFSVGVVLPRGDVAQRARGVVLVSQTIARPAMQVLGYAPKRPALF